MSIVIQPIHAEEHYRVIEELQRDIWGAPEIEIIPFDVLLTAQKNGGIVLGAFDLAQSPPKLIGFTFGFVGLLPGGEIKLCSHMAGVLNEYRDRNIGYRLKLAQREHMLNRGIKLITWTFDPLESRNARFNFHKLGVTCNTFLPNLYGEMRDALNAGLPSDRFQVDWHLASERVKDYLNGTQRKQVPSAMERAGIPLVNPPRKQAFLHPADEFANFAALTGQLLLVQIPANFQEIKAADFGLARAWRTHIRTLFEIAFAGGYTAVDLLVEDGACFYLLETADFNDTKQ